MKTREWRVLIQCWIKFEKGNSIDEAERIFSLFSDGGQIFMPMQETFFAHRFAMLRDRFRTSWMVINERMPPQGA